MKNNEEITDIRANGSELILESGRISPSPGVAYVPCLLLTHLDLRVYGEHRMTDSVCHGKAAEMLFHSYYVQRKHLLSVKRASK